MRGALLLAWLAALASPTAAECVRHGRVVPPALPDAAEVSRLIRAAWAPGRWPNGWQDRFAQEARRPGEQAAFVRVASLSCSYHYVTALCEIMVVGRFANGEERQARMVSQFDRDCAGHLSETIAMYEVRERRP